MPVNPERFRATFDALTRAGATPAGGLNRPALSELHLEAREAFRMLALKHGLDFRVDEAGNHSAVLPCGRPDAPTLLIGSHLDSVPNGGRFDGTLGIAAALEVVFALRETGKPRTVTLEAIDFTDEEGTWVSLMGSRAAAGLLIEDDLQSPRGHPEAFQEALGRAGLTRAGILRASRAGEPLAGYLELHIEQGSRLVDTGKDIGVVTGMVGIWMYRVTFHGRADHAGTSVMTDRLDAAQGAATFCLAVRRTVLERFPDCVANVGRMTFAPGAFNIVPESVTTYMELRNQDPDRAQELEDALRAEAARSADLFGLGLDFVFQESVRPAAMDEETCHALEDAANRLDLSHRRLPSLAGHDAQSMARLCPAGLIFVPSVGGYSHSPREYTRWRDCLQGAETLLGAAGALAGMG